MSRPADWLAAFDDVLVGRLRHCTLCGGGEGAQGYLDIMEAPPFAVAILVCTRCRANDPERTALDALLRERYDLKRPPMSAGERR